MCVASYIQPINQRIIEALVDATGKSSFQKSGKMETEDISTGLIAALETINIKDVIYIVAKHMTKCFDLHL